MPQTKQLTMGVISGAIGAVLPIIAAAFYFGGLDENVKALDKRVAGLESAPPVQQVSVAAIAQELVSKHKAALRGVQGNTGLKGDIGDKGDTGASVDGASIPRGVVVAFDRDDLTEDTCPDGWSPFLRGRARMIVGAGDPSKSQLKLGFDENGNPLSGYVHRQHGGEEEVMLTIKQMPKHGHSFAGTGIEMGSRGGFQTNRENKLAKGTNSDRGKFIPEGTISETGGDQPHNNMPPYIALYFCKKD